MAETLICTQCGSHKLKKLSDTQYVCDSCGTTTDLDLFNNEIGLKLNLAMTTRQTAKFDEAKSLYEQVKSILRPDQCAPEVYFGLFACEYKVLFELDNRTGNRVPIFYSSSESNVFDNKNLKKALEQARDVSFSKFEEYNELAMKVEAARMSYQKLSKLVTPFDIFICFKKTDLDGISDTRDYSTAMSLYSKLVDKFPKYHIFFSEKTLAEIPLTEYEPNIYYALHTSKILMVVSSKRDYLESQWVKNEWTRFLAINKANAIIPIYLKGTNVNIFPSEILKNNAYEEGDYDRIFTSIDSIMNSERYVKERDAEEKRRKDEIFEEVQKRLSKSFNAPNSNLSNMFKRMINDLSDGVFENAQKICDSIFNVDAEHPLAWLYSYLIDKKLTSLEQLKDQYESNWTEDRAIKKAIEFSKIDGYQDERNKIEDELYKWISYMVTEAIDLTHRKKYDDARSKLVKVATHVEEFGRDHRFDYFYHNFLLEMNCTNTNDLVSLQGIEKNAYFSKALKYANENQHIQLDEIIKVAKDNASKYQEQIIKNNTQLEASFAKLDLAVKSKFDEGNKLIELCHENEKEAKIKIKNFEDEAKKSKEQVILQKAEIIEKKAELAKYYSSRSEKMSRFLCNIRAIILGTVTYSILFIYAPGTVILSFTFIIPLLIIAILFNFINISIHKRQRDGRTIKGFVIFGIISGMILLNIPLLIGYSRNRYYKKIDSKTRKLDNDIYSKDQQLKTIEDKKQIDIKSEKEFIDRRMQYAKKVTEIMDTITSRSNQLKKDYPIFSLDKGITLKVKLEKDMNMFKESMVKLDEQIYDISHIAF